MAKKWSKMILRVPVKTYFKVIVSFMLLENANQYKEYKF